MALDSFEPIDDDFNPYAAPKARPEPERLGGDLTEAEAIRQTYLNHEASVRSLGGLYLIGAVLNSLQTVFYFLVALGLATAPDRNAQNLDPSVQAVANWVTAFFALGMATLGFFLGIGLRGLQVWARWTALVFAVIGLIFALIVSLVAMVANPIVGLFVLLIAGGITGYIVYLLASSKTTYICSPEYKEIIALTPHVKYRMSMLVKVLLIVVVVFVLLALVVPLIMMAGRGMR